MRKHALLVGVEQYEDKAIDSLKFAAADASALGVKLGEVCGFDKIRILDGVTGAKPTKNAILDAFEECAAGLEPDDLFLFFFAGHGVEVNGVSVLLACDTMFKRSYDGITRQNLDGALSGVRAGKRILIFDACRNAPECTRSGAGNAMAEAFARDIRACAAVGNESSRLAGTSLLFACDAGQRAYECPDSGHGVLTHFLLEGLAKPEDWPGGQLQLLPWIDIALQRVPAWVRENTGHDQTPHYQHFGRPILEPLAINTRAAIDQEAAVRARLEIELQAKLAAEQRAQREKEARLAAEKLEAEQRAQHEASREHKAGDTKTVMLPGNVPLELVWCPAGTFWMGSPKSEKGRWDNETRHRVTLTRGFWIGKHPVTQGQWEAVMGTNPSDFKGADLPVEMVSWEDSQRFFKKVNKLMAGGGFRLPSEAEWEYACRAGTETAFCWENSLDASMANVNGNHGRTVCVGQSRPNGWGLHDMHGNIHEWCQDWYGDYPAGAVADPGGAVSGTKRMYRGGSWFLEARFCRSACRGYNVPSHPSNDLGFRIASSEEAIEAPLSDVRTAAGPTSPLPKSPFLKRCLFAGLTVVAALVLGGIVGGWDAASLTGAVSRAMGRSSSEKAPAPQPETTPAVSTNAVPSMAELEAGKAREEALAAEKLEEDQLEQHKKETPQRSAGDTVKVDLGGGVEMELVWCPAGSFWMGSPEGEAERYDDETRHRVTLTRGFWLGKTEVTQGQWEAVMGYGLEEHARKVGVTNQVGVVDAKHPMVQVNWDDSVEFCRRLSMKLPGGGQFRLPTEAEWEHACHAGIECATYAGDMEIIDKYNAPVLDAVAWYGGNSNEGYSGRGWNTAKGVAGYRSAGEKTPNAWGLFDMLGNVYEWCGDRYEKYPSGDAGDPSGAVSGTERVCRGGSWVSPARDCRSAARASAAQSKRFNHLGFRVAKGQLVQCEEGALLTAAKLEAEQLAQRNTSREHKVGDTETVMLLGNVPLELVWCPPGAFWMGSPDDEVGREIDETRHHVTLTRGFWMGKYEVTQEQWEAMMGTNSSSFKGTYLPVEQVSWEDSQRFLEKVNALAGGGGFRLPSEAEWEYACRAGTESAFSYGNSLDMTAANLNGLSSFRAIAGRSNREKTRQVGRFRPNGWGLYDMHGNVLEWCQDGYGAYPSWAVTDPVATSGVDRVARGGSWATTWARYCRSANRYNRAQSASASSLGFRVVREQLAQHEEEARLEAMKLEAKQRVQREEEAWLAAVAADQLAQREEEMRQRLAGDTETVMLPGNVPLELVWCPPGTFWMGRTDDDKTRHQVTLTRGFWLGKTEMTQRQWEAVMRTNPSRFNGMDMPVECVSWEDSQRFLEKLNKLVVGGGFRLPSEAEWEYACRAGTETAFCYGDSLGATMANFNGNHPYGGAEKGIHRERTTQVDLFPPNGWGLHDMHGNVAEWCQDWYGDLSADAVTDPFGATSGTARVRRGGGWVDTASCCLSGFRYSSIAPSDDRYSTCGFRVARSERAMRK